LAPEVSERVVALTLTDWLGEVTHWMGRAMAKAVGINLSATQRIWRTHGLQPHRMRQFKLSNAPQFAAKFCDIVGLNVDPPAHAVALSMDEKSQIPALDRTRPGLPLKRGRCGTMTHDYIRNGTTTLFAALNALEGSLTGRCMQRRRRDKAIRQVGRVKGKAVADSPYRRLGYPICPIGALHAIGPSLSTRRQRLPAIRATRKGRNEIVKCRLGERGCVPMPSGAGRRQ
jgi:hypothetical protein